MELSAEREWKQSLFAFHSFLSIAACQNVDLDEECEELALAGLCYEFKANIFAILFILDCPK